MDLEHVAKALKELGHPTRLSIYKTVVKAGYKGIAEVRSKRNWGFRTRRYRIISPAWPQLTLLPKEEKDALCTVLRSTKIWKG